MDKSIKISEVSQLYNISKRTLRYYEEIGLLQSEKKEGSHYRFYNKATLYRLEQILLLKSLKFSLTQVSEILLTQDNRDIHHKLQHKLEQLELEISHLTFLKKLVFDIVTISEKQGIHYVNFYELLKEQIYVQEAFEGMSGMSQYTKDIITLEFGMNMIDNAQEIITRIKEFRKELEEKINKEIPLIRIRDNETLKPNEYKIFIKEILVANEEIESLQDTVSYIMKQLKSSITNNITNICV